jgi:hypothetical protein
MDRDSHEELHQTQGTYLDPINGGGKATAGTYTLNTASDAATTPGFDQAVVKDEDLRTTIPAWIQGTYTTMKIGAGSIAEFDIAASFPFISSGSYLQVNDPTTGAMTNGINNRFYNVYQVLIPVASDENSQKYRMVMLQPQKTFIDQTTAEAEDVNGLLFGDLTELTAEFKVYARLCYQTASGDSNTGKCRLMSITYVLGTKANSINVGGIVSTNHAALSNLAWTDSAHTGTADKYAGFDASGNPVYLDGGSGGSYTLPIASSTVLGGIKVGTNLSIDGTGVLSSSESAASLGVLIGGSGDATPNDSDYVATALTAGGVLKKITWTNVKAFLKTYFDGIYLAASSAVSTYLGLTDTSDTTYTGKDKHVPMVNEANSELDLTPTEIATFFSLADFDETTYTGKDGYIFQVNESTGKVKLVANQTLPVKASAAELNAGTDDAKFATAKGLKDAKFIGIHIGTTAPSDTTLLWLDTN